MTWNSYSRFAGDAIDFQNRTTHDVLKLYRLANATAGFIETFRLRAIEFAEKLHAAKLHQALELSALSFEFR